MLNAISTGEGSHGLGGWCTSEMAAAPDGVSSGGGPPVGTLQLSYISNSEGIGSNSELSLDSQLLGALS